MVDKDEKEEDKFDFDSAGEKRGDVSLESARVLTIQPARDDSDFHGRRYLGQDFEQSEVNLCCV